jgi:hypothetical protein
MPYTDIKTDLILNEISEEQLHSQESLPPNQYWLTPDDTEKLKEFNLPLGMILPSAIVQEHPALHLLDGSILSQSGIYSNFATLLKQQVAEGKIVAYTNAQYDGELNTYGQCGHFVIDDTNNTFRLPTITKYIENLTNMSDIGKAFNAGLPALEGSFQLANHPSVNTTADGVFTSRDGASASYTGASSSSRARTDISFSASKISKIFGRSDTVQPDAVKYPYYIVLANNLEVDASSLDIGGIVNDISLISQKTFSNYPMPSDTYETLTPTTSGTVFIAPTNGWYCATGTSTSTYHCQVSLTNANGFTSRSQISGYKDTGCRCFLPAKRGDSITFTNQNMTSMVVRFYYAEGEI